MFVVRKGITRIVIVFENIVIKIPNFTCQWNHFLKGILANISENTTWKVAVKHNPEFVDLLCPVKWCTWGGWVLCMCKAKIIEREEWDNVSISEHQKYIPGDDKIDNYGVFEGRVVKIDYAD